MIGKRIDNYLKFIFLCIHLEGCGTCAIRIDNLYIIIKCFNSKSNVAWFTESPSYY